MKIIMKFEIEKAKEILRQTPSTLTYLLQNLSDEWIKNNEGGETWSPYDVVGHLIHGDKTNWIQRIRVILEYGETKQFEPFDRFAQFKLYNRKSLPELLAIFIELRNDNLKILDELNITNEKLQLKGKHPELGTVTLSQLISTWVVHDLNHIAQIVRVIAKQYSNEVGPWKAYLSILNK